MKKKLLEQFVEIKGKNLYILKGEVFDSFVNAKTNKLPCGYRWVTLDGVLNCPDDELINAKCGQAATGNVIGRVRSYGDVTRSAQIIVSIIINDAFNKEKTSLKNVVKVVPSITRNYQEFLKRSSQIIIAALAAKALKENVAKERKKEVG